MVELMNKIAVVDLETTGPNINDGDEIIQIGLVVYSEGLIIHEYSMLINPERDIPFHIQQLTGIKIEDVEKAPKFESVVTLWHERLKDCIFVAHNLDFDLHFLGQAFDKYGIEFNPIAIDSVKLAKIILPRARGFNLTDLSQYFNISFDGAHDALMDAKVTSQIVSQLAKLVIQMPQSLISRMEPFIRKLRYDEIVFFLHPTLFCLSDPPTETKTMQASNFGYNLSKIEAMQSKYINDQWNKVSHLIIENKNQPINHKIVLDLAQKRIEDEKILMSLPSLADLNFMEDYLIENNFIGKFMVLKSSKHFLHEKAFDELINKYNFEYVNQQELLKISASMHWIFYSQFGDYSEINQELIVEDLLEKYCLETLKNSRHTNYHKMLEAAKEKSILFTNDYYLQTLFQKKQAISQALINRKLIISNLSLFTQTARLSYQDNFYLSKLFTSLRSLISHYNYLNSEQELDLYQVKQLEKCSQMLHRFLALITDFLKEDHYDYNMQQELISKYLSSKSELFEATSQLLLEIQSCLNTLLPSFVPSQFDNIRNHLHNVEYYSRQLNGILNRKLDNNYLVINSKRIKNKFYEIELIVRPLIFSSKQLEWLNSFSRALLISPGDYHYNDRFGLSSWLNLEDFKYHVMPSLNSIEKKQVFLPAEYIQESQDSKRAEDLSQYLADQIDSLKDLIIIITSNKNQNQIIYKTLITQTYLTNRYTISAQSISGSTNRIRRRLLEADKNIVIITERFFYKEYWADTQKEMQIFQYNLPFYSSKQTDIMAITDYLLSNRDEIESFELVQLPLMIQRFKYLLSYLTQYYPESEIYLLDKRLYTKYYGSEVIESLSSITDFNLVY